jgi:hypothetical protein
VVVLKWLWRILLEDADGVKTYYIMAMSKLEMQRLGLSSSPPPRHLISISEENLVSFTLANYYCSYDSCMIITNVYRRLPFLFPKTNKYILVVYREVN